MTIYLVDEPFLDVAISYASRDPGARLVLLQDAVYSSARADLPGQVYAVEDDVTRRGLRAKMPPGVHVIGYDELVRMIEDEKVVNFL